MAREKKCLYSALAPLHFLCRVFGVAPYSLHATKSRRKLYKSEFSDVLLSLAPTGIFFACFFLGLKDCSYEFYNILPAITAISQRYANVAIGVTNFACAYLHRRNIIKAVAVLSSTDNLLRRHSPVLSYRNCLRRVLLVIAVGLILNSVMLSMDLYKVLAEESRYFCMLLYSCSYTTTIVVECQMGILLMEIKKRFQVLNGAVEELTEELNERIFTENFQLLRYFGDSSRKLICYSKLHRKLCHVSELTSESFQAQVVVKILIAFVYIMSSLFFLFINMRIEPDIFQYFDAFLAFVYWSLLNFLEVTFIIYVHTSLAKEVSRRKNGTWCGSVNVQHKHPRRSNTEM